MKNYIITRTLYIRLQYIHTHFKISLQTWYKQSHTHRLSNSLTGYKEEEAGPGPKACVPITSVVGRKHLVCVDVKVLSTLAANRKWLLRKCVVAVYR